MLGLAAAAFVGIFFLNIPFPAIVLGAGLIGFLGGRAGLPHFEVGGGHGPSKAKGGTPDTDLLGDVLPPHARPTVVRALRASSI
jgi:chromate transporter